MKDFEPQIENCVDLLVKRLGEVNNHGSAALNMSLWLHLYAYDSLAEVNLSEKMGFLETGEDVDGYIAAADRVFFMVGLVG